MRLTAIVNIAASLAFVATDAHAQSESALRNAFEGKTIAVKIDMPATAHGVDVYPLEPTPVNWRQVADRSKDYGTALKMGTQVMITKMVVKKDHIEFQLGGGGYGTFGDETGTAASAREASESKEERALRDSVRKEPNDARKKAYEKELTNLRSARERENSRARAEAAQANELREANVRARRVVSGSRFNVWYKPTVPPDAMTPEGVMTALKPYVDFSGAAGSNSAADSPMGSSATTRPAAGANALLSIRKGLLLADVELLLGPANTASESKEGVLTLMKRNYLHDGKKITASFVNRVLIDYAIGPQ
ncbi:MAG: hypothetical protein H7Z40_12355 [Phycisphaerae bacterium]|nr:hypothetical protein [Gemmatimonadaceae bacterium]